MKIRSAVALFPVVSFALFGCGQSPHTETEEISLQPASLDEASVSLDRIERLNKVDPAAAQIALQKLQPRLDELNHLIARVEAVPGRFVSFYEPQPGVIGISERGPVKGEHVLQQSDLQKPISALYRQLAKGAEPPAALLEAEKREAGVRASNDGESHACDVTTKVEQKTEEKSEGVGTSQQALTSADGPWWAANVCYKSGDFRGCFPNWGGGGYASASAKTSFFQVAPYSGDWVSVRFQYEGATRFTDPVYNGQWGGWWWHSDSYADCWCSPICACGSFDYNRRSHRWDILNASGDGFHWTHAFKWSCGSTLSCDDTP